MKKIYFKRFILIFGILTFGIVVGFASLRTHDALNMKVYTGHDNISVAEKALLDNPNDVVALKTLAIAYEGKAGEYSISGHEDKIKQKEYTDKCLLYWKKALSLDPNNHYVQYFTGRVILNYGNKDDENEREGLELLNKAAGDKTFFQDLNISESAKMSLTAYNARKAGFIKK